MGNLLQSLFRSNEDLSDEDIEPRLQDMSTSEFSTPDFSTMNCSTPDFFSESLTSYLH